MISCITPCSSPIANHAKEPDSFTDSMEKLISKAESLPGCADTDPAKHKENLQSCLKALASSGCWSCEQGENNNRNIAVAMQAIAENVFINQLEKDKDSRLSIIVHTNHPPTPLCMESKEEMATRADTFLNPMIRNDRAAQSTVTSRIETNQQFLNAGNQVDFCSLFGTPREHKQDQDIFDGKVAANPSLFAHQMVENPEEDLSGATYIFKDSQGKKLTFGVRITQADTPSKKCSLFLSRNENDKKHAPYLHKLVDYIDKNIKALPDDNSVSGRAKQYELQNLRRLII